MRKWGIFYSVFLLLFSYVAVCYADIVGHWLVWDEQQTVDVKTITITSQNYDNFSLREGKILIYTTYFLFKYDEPQGRYETYLDGVEVFIGMSNSALPFGSISTAFIGVKFFRFNHKSLPCGSKQQELIYNLGNLKQKQSIRFTIGRREGENFARVSLIDNHRMKWIKELVFPNFGSSGHIIRILHGVETNANYFNFKGGAFNLWFQDLDSNWHLIPWGSYVSEQWTLSCPCNITIKDWDYGLWGVGGEIVWQCDSF